MRPHAERTRNRESAIRAAISGAIAKAERTVPLEIATLAVRGLWEIELLAIARPEIAIPAATARPVIGLVPEATVPPTLAID